jgi:hypothetical protein
MQMINFDFQGQYWPIIALANLRQKITGGHGDFAGQGSSSVLGAPDHMVASLVDAISVGYELKHANILIHMPGLVKNFLESWKPFIPWLKPEVSWLAFIRVGLLWHGPLASIKRRREPLEAS